MVTLGLQRFDLISPATAIGPYTMHKNNRRFFVIGGLRLGAVATIKVKSRIALNFDVFMILDLVRMTGTPETLRARGFFESDAELGVIIARDT
jgi:hypothetical protein